MRVSSPILTSVLLVLLSSAPMLTAPARAGGWTGFLPDSFSLFGDVPGLCELDFRFTSGDRHVRTLKAIPNLFSSRMLVDLSDRSNDRTGRALLRWWDLGATGSLRFGVNSFCRDGCWIRAVPITSDQELVLAGVELRYLDGDHHVRDIEVRPFPEAGWIWVRMTDNSSYYAFAASVAYVVMPRGDFERFSSRSTDDEWSDVSRPKPAGMSLLQGFSARFRNGDHHLERLHIDVCNTAVRGTFHDGDGVNDPFRLDVDYIVRRP